MKKFFAITPALALALGMLASAPASATPITVNNPSFEQVGGGLPNLCVGSCAAFDIASIPGWTDSGTSGQWITGGQGNPNAIDGNVLAYTNDGSISQNVGSAVAGTTYTLQVNLLHRTDEPMDGVIQLEIGGVVVKTATGVDLGAGTWNEWTAVYLASDLDAGKIVTILLSTNGAPGGQGDFDNVRLDGSSSTVPEPATLTLLGAGLLGLGLIRRKRVR
jgi:hypothetical protein